MTHHRHSPDGAGQVIDRALEYTLRHADDWGKVWFGLIFWGSVLFATAEHSWPTGPTSLQLLGAATIGLAGGLAARRRGYWL